MPSVTNIIKDELAKDGGEEDGGALAAAKALTISRGQTCMLPSANAARCRVQVEEWKDGDEIGVEGKKRLGQLCERRRDGRKHRTERCKDLGG